MPHTKDISIYLYRQIGRDETFYIHLHQSICNHRKIFNIPGMSTVRGFIII